MKNVKHAMSNDKWGGAPRRAFHLVSLSPCHLFLGTEPSAWSCLAAESTFLMVWPPNWLRRAALKRAEKLYLSRDSKRAKREAAMTGTGTFSSMAAWMVQRPSPLSSTYGWMDAREDSAARAFSASSRSHERTTLPRFQTLAT